MLFIDYIINRFYLGLGHTVSLESETVFNAMRFVQAHLRLVVNTLTNQNREFPAGIVIFNALGLL
jgi:hypothetical protein